MTDLTKQIEALAADATPGPWQHHCSHVYGPDPERGLVCQFRNGPWLTSDRDLIVLLRNSVPQILAALSKADALAEADAMVEKLRRRSTDRQYIIDALVNMLGPNALQVWRSWQDNGVQRVHYDWGPDAAALTGEERAAVILELEATLRSGQCESIEDVDDPRTAPRDVREFIAEVEARTKPSQPIVEKRDAE